MNIQLLEKSENWMGRTSLTAACVMGEGSLTRRYLDVSAIGRSDDARERGDGDQRK